MRLEAGTAGDAYNGGGGAAVQTDESVEFSLLRLVRSSSFEQALLPVCLPKVEACFGLNFCE